jgi:hypothetical protein
VESSCERGNEPSGSIKCWETTEGLHNLWPPEWYLAPQSQSVIYVQLRRAESVLTSSQLLPFHFLSPPQMRTSFKILKFTKLINFQLSV